MKDHTILLFFDDWNLNRRENLVRRVGKPKLVPEGIFVDPYMNPSWAYPTIFRIPETGLWRCLYQSHSNDRKHRLALTAESRDGVHWEISDTSSWTLKK